MLLPTGSNYGSESGRKSILRNLIFWNCFGSFCLSYSGSVFGNTEKGNDFGNGFGTIAVLAASYYGRGCPCVQSPPLTIRRLRPKKHPRTSKGPPQGHPYDPQQRKLNRVGIDLFTRPADQPTTRPAGQVSLYLTWRIARNHRMTKICE